MALAFDELKPRALVDATRRDEDVVRPKRELAISRCASETDALVDESRPDAQATCPWLDEQEAQLRHGLRLVDAEHAADTLPVDFGDPTALALAVEVGDELRDDVRHQRLERFVPPVFLPVDRAVPLDDPAHIAGAVRAESDLRRRARSRPQPSLDRAHRGDESFLLGGRDAVEHHADLIARLRLEWRDRGLAARGQAEDRLAVVVGRRRPGEDAPSREAAEDPREVAGVDPEIAPQLAGR